MQAGISKRQLTPKIGGLLMGYGNRNGGSTGLHDPLFVRALALQHAESTLIICSIEICFLRAPDVRAIQAYVINKSSIKVENLLITTTHTHSAPAAHDDDAWHEPFVSSVGDTILAAYDNLQPASIGIEAGFLYGHSINRRWLDRPIDPSVSVIRVDAADGKPLAVVGNFACHAVVMGYDNYQISGDWCGYASRLFEADRDANFIAIVTQGGSGDINPLTETVRQRLNAGHPVTTIGKLTTYYGNPELENWWNIEDRAGGTFIECETLARAYNAEVLKVWKRTITQTDAPLWIEYVPVDATLGDDEPEANDLPQVLRSFLPDMSQETLQLPCMAIGISNTIILTQPGEVFSEVAVNSRKMCQQMGYRHAITMSYANGSYGYLPPENAFAEGGYEVVWPLGLGISRHLQNRIQASMRDILKKHSGK